MLNMILGVFMLIALIAYAATKAVFALTVVVFIGAMMNITTGLSYQKRKDKRTLGACMIMLGIVIMFIYIFFVLRFL